MTLLIYPFSFLQINSKLSRVLINIIKNAVEAVENSGVVLFTTNLTSGNLIITDTGKGILQHSADNLFSPFLSTKKDGQGIGLTLVKEVLLNHGFKYSLQSAEPV